MNKVKVFLYKWGKYIIFGLVVIGMVVTFFVFRRGKVDTLMDEVKELSRQLKRKIKDYEKIISNNDNYLSD